MANLQGELDATRREEDALLTLRLEGPVSGRGVCSSGGGRSGRREELQHRMEASERGPAEIVADARAVFEFAAKAKTAFQEGTPVQGE